MATAAASTSGRKETREAEQVYADVWLCFCEALLPTHRSKFTQFLLFHALARGPASWTSRFVEALVQGIADSARPQVMRCACAAYLASFLARAAFVTETVAVRALEAVVQVGQGWHTARQARPGRLDGEGELCLRQSHASPRSSPAVVPGVHRPGCGCCARR